MSVCWKDPDVSPFKLPVRFSGTVSDDEMATDLIFPLGNSS